MGCLPHLAEHVSYCLFADMINKQDCKYGDNCTFAYHQEEIDVWTEERKGTLNRDLLFDPLGGVKRGSLTIAKLLKEHQGIFTFLCEVPACLTISPVPSRPRHAQGWAVPLVTWSLWELLALEPVGVVRRGSKTTRDRDCQKVRPGDPIRTQILSGFSFYKGEN